MDNCVKFDADHKLLLDPARDLLEPYGPPVPLDAQLRKYLMQLVEEDLVVWFRSYQEAEGHAIVAASTNPDLARERLAVVFPGVIRTVHSPWPTSHLKMARDVLDRRYEEWELLSIGGRINRAGLSQIVVEALVVHEGLANWARMQTPRMLEIEAAIRPLNP
jgi:hypothetical protein